MRRPALQFLGMGLVAVFLVVGTIALGVRHIQRSEGTAAYSKSGTTAENNLAERSTVSLRARTRKTKSGSTIQLQWDASAQPIRGSSYGILYVYDGGVPAKIVLRRRTLDSGSTNYMPASDEIAFHLILEKGRPGGESVLVLLGSREGLHAGFQFNVSAAESDSKRR